MATRSNIIIKNGNKYRQLYRHQDSYPHEIKGILQGYINELFDGGNKATLQDADKVAEYIHEKDDRFKVEDKIRLHPDIEYLYVIDLKNKITLCYKLWIWEERIYNSIDRSFDYINGKAQLNPNYTKEYELKFGEIVKRDTKDNVYFFL